MLPNTAMVFAAHPDDAEYFAGGTLAMLRSQGWQIHIVTVTDGRVGTLETPGQALADERREEAKKAAKTLGAEEPIFLKHHDFELESLAPGVLRGEFVRLIRKLRPMAVFAHDPLNTIEAHPDHRAVAQAALEAVTFSQLPGVCPEQIAEGLVPHWTPEKYFFSDRPELANKAVDITNWFEVKVTAMIQHHSQVAFLVEDLLLQAHIAGVPPAALPQPEQYQDMFINGLRNLAAGFGKPHGMALAEVFRYQRFHPLVEDLITQG